MKISVGTIVPNCGHLSFRFMSTKTCSLSMFPSFLQGKTLKLSQISIDHVESEIKYQIVSCVESSIAFI